MTTIKDEEDLLESIQSYFKTNLNTHISALNTEKSDWDIDTIPEEDDFFLLRGEIIDFPNHSFLSIAIDDEPEAESNFDDLKLSCNVSIEYAFSNPKDKKEYRRSLRYMRAIRDCAQRFVMSTVYEVDKPTITSSSPILVNLSGRRMIVSGITMNFTFA